jgi:L-ascorbate metabolism protein UlaG (beta-lactamase superfamily)
MKLAYQRNDILLDEILNAPTAENRFYLWWMGQSGFLIKWKNKHLLIDPYLSDSLSDKYYNTNKPHVRMTEKVIDPAKLDFIDIVTSSHNHTDHLDPATLIALRDGNPDIKMVLPAANIDFAKERLGDERPKKFIGLDKGDVEMVDGFEFTGVSSAHNDITKDEDGRCLYMGFVIKFGPFTVYHSGDTLWHRELVSELLPHAPDLVLLPINGNDLTRGVEGNLNGTEAAALAKAVNARCVIPCHYDMFEFNTATTDEFAAACTQLGQPCMIMQNGESQKFTK